MLRSVIEHLEKFATEERVSLFKKNIRHRTKYISVLLEDIYQSQNASAVLRTSDGFGIQDIHIVEKEHEYNINPDVAIGSDKWLTLNYYNYIKSISEVIDPMKKSGYRIVATTPHVNDKTLDNFDVSKGKFMLCFGSEKPGLSDELIAKADEFIKIPMFGFTESFNISVSASICLHHLVMKLHSSKIKWQMTDEEMDSLLLYWLKKSIRGSEKIIESFCLENKISPSLYL